MVMGRDAAAYGWCADLPDTEVLGLLLGLNQRQSKCRYPAH